MQAEDEGHVSEGHPEYESHQTAKKYAQFSETMEQTMQTLGIDPCEFQ